MLSCKMHPTNGSNRLIWPRSSPSKISAVLGGHKAGCTGLNLCAAVISLNNSSKLSDSDSLAAACYSKWANWSDKTYKSLPPLAKNAKVAALFKAGKSLFRSSLASRFQAALPKNWPIFLFFSSTSASKLRTASGFALDELL